MTSFAPPSEAIDLAPQRGMKFWSVHSGGKCCLHSAVSVARGTGRSSWLGSMLGPPAELDAASTNGNATLRTTATARRLTTRRTSGAGSGSTGRGSMQNTCGVLGSMWEHIRFLGRVTGLNVHGSLRRVSSSTPEYNDRR